MRIGVIGAGRIGGGAARLLARAGHELLLSYSRDPDKLRAQAEEIGAQAGTPAEAAAFGDVVILAVPWPAIDDAVAQAGSLDGRIVIDTTNPFGAGGWQVPEGRTTTQVNQERLAGAHVVKSFNTLTAAFQQEAAGRTGEKRVAMFLAGDDAEAKRVVAGLIDDAGFDPVDAGTAAQSSILEAPRREGAVYGEEYRKAEALAAVEAAQAGRPIPPTPVYG
ncbi:MAG TPA: NAD(P)-binding domain-containing protein [Thermoleophilaceae bacterium]|jgi:predicted dinucleotide-binding enzyme|nr:NAD(P)-binding domain-containing protein [Thermoleophilaceae bacterium]